MELRQFLYLFEGVEDTETGASLTKQGLYLGTQEPKRTIDWRIYINSYDTNKVSIKNGRSLILLDPIKH